MSLLDFLSLLDSGDVAIAMASLIINVLVLALIIIYLLRILWALEGIAKSLKIMNKRENIKFVHDYQEKGVDVSEYE